MRLNLEIPNNQKIILHLCAKEGSDTLPYREAGYDVRIVARILELKTIIHRKTSME